MTRPQRPGGEPPPAHSADGVPLGPIAAAVADRYFEEFPGDLERYGPVAREWEVHDTLWTLAWAANPHIDLAAQIEWLATVLAARDFPLAQLARNLELAADAGEGALGGDAATELRAAAASVRARA